MRGHGEKLTRKQEQALAALLAHDTIEAAAGAVGVSEKTLRTWLTAPGFRDAYRAARQEVLERTVSRLLAANGQAVDALVKNLKCGNPTSENRAAELVLSLTAKGVEALDLAQEVEGLKKLVAEMRHGHRRAAAGDRAAEEDHRPPEATPDGGGGEAA